LQLRIINNSISDRRPATCIFTHNSLCTENIKSIKSTKNRVFQTLKRVKINLLPYTFIRICQAIL
jgi:hypothetical protein